MKHLIAGLSLLLCSSAAFAEELIREVSWQEMATEGRLSSGQIVPPEGERQFAALRIENPNPKPVTVTLLALDEPGVTQPRYAIKGQVRYEKVEGKGYLELWNHFPGGARYFSRTLARSGPMKYLTGSSEWRPFALPFFADESKEHPSRLVVNVVLPGRGVVELGPVTLLEYRADENLQAVTGQWWPERTGGLIGGILGSVLGCMGGLIGCLAGFGKARNLVFGLVAAMFAVGILGVGSGVAAVALGQPFHVYYPLLLLGALCTLLPAALYQPIRSRYEQAELRKMSAMDAAVH